MRESAIENKVCAVAKANGWRCYKFTSPNNRGVPDRLFLRNGEAVFVEFKRPGAVPTALQKKIIADIRAEGFRVLVIDSLEAGLHFANS